MNHEANIMSWISSGENIIVIWILLAWLFVLGILFGKILLYKHQTTIEEYEANNSDHEEDFQKYINRNISNSAHSNSDTIEMNYSKNSNHTKNGIDTILETPTPHTHSKETTILAQDRTASVEDSTLLRVAERQKAKNKCNLKLIEWIWPKIEELLHSQGITHFSQLASMSPKEIQNILKTGGPRMVLHDPATWPKQAHLAWEWKMKELQTYQDHLNKWREV